MPECAIEPELQKEVDRLVEVMIHSEQSAEAGIVRRLLGIVKRNSLRLVVMALTDSTKRGQTDIRMNLIACVCYESSEGCL